LNLWIFAFKGHHWAEGVIPRRGIDVAYQLILNAGSHLLFKDGGIACRLGWGCRGRHWVGRKEIIPFFDILGFWLLYGSFQIYLCY